MTNYSNRKKIVELADSIKEKSAPKPRVNGSRKYRRRKLPKPVKSDDGVFSSKIVDGDNDFIYDVILNRVLATKNQGGLLLQRLSSLKE